jgi:lipoprotein NlpI
MQRSNSYNCLGVAYALIGNHEMATLSFLQAVELDTSYNRASQRLSIFFISIVKIYKSSAILINIKAVITIM